jgi:hypothetical protein
MTAALYYHPEAYTTSGPKLTGRNAAGESFLRGFLSHSTAAPFFVQAQTIDHARHFAARVAEAGRREPVQAIVGGAIGGLAKAGVVFHPGPGSPNTPGSAAASATAPGASVASPTPRRLPPRWTRSPT